MGAGESTEKLGQRVLIAKAKLNEDLKSATQRYEYLKQHSPQTLKTMIESVSDSFGTCSPFLESTVLIAWLADAEKCKQVMLRACKKVLQAPIDHDEYQWFKQYVFTSNIWMLKTDSQNDKFMYAEMLTIANAMSSDIVTNMDSIYEHLQSHKQWPKVMAIDNQAVVVRQDDAKVGLLHETGLSNVFEAKSDDEQSAEMKNFIDANMAINMLTSTASKLNREFQQHIKLAMSAHGIFKAAPMKKVERSLSKVENDYNRASFPKAAKLLDLVRCSVTFNTVEQLLTGYEAFLHHIKSNPSMIALARVKNGFLNTEKNGYRDIKLNVIYTSQDPEHKNVRMICEVQFLLINYLQEKRKIHKLYSILREETYFKMVVSDTGQKAKLKDIKDLRFKESLNVGKEVALSEYTHEYGMYRCSVDSELGLLGMEGHNWFGVVDMSTKKVIWNLKRETFYVSGLSFGYETHDWLTINRQKYLSLQTGKNTIKMFKVVYVSNDNNSFKFVEDEKYQIVHSSNKGAEATINFCDFDQNYKHIFLVTDYCVLQKRAVSDINNVLQSIKLDEPVHGSQHKNFQLSADGRFCSLGGGRDKPYFYVIDIENELQYKMTSPRLADAYVPCFINGETEFIAVSDYHGILEIWDINKKQLFKTIEIETKKFISSMASIHNILAIGSYDKKLRLYDVRNWECFYTTDFQCYGKSLHLTEDLKYVSFAGPGEDKCVVLQIE